MQGPHINRSHPSHPALSPSISSTRNPSSLHHPSSSRPTDTMAETHTYDFNITMTCGGCSGAIDRVLKKLDGSLALPPRPREAALELTVHGPGAQASRATKSHSRTRRPTSSPRCRTRRCSKRLPRRARRSTRPRPTASRSRSRCPPPPERARRRRQDYPGPGTGRENGTPTHAASLPCMPWDDEDKGYLKRDERPGKEKESVARSCLVRRLNRRPLTRPTTQVTEPRQ